MKDGIVLHPEHGLNPSIELLLKGAPACEGMRSLYLYNT